MRKERTDKGKHRNKYDNSLPKEYIRLLKRCNSKGMELSLSVDETVSLCNSQCVYCGSDGYGIDRIDPKKGYIEGNVVPCCTQCNMMKWMYTPQQFISHAKRITDWQSTIS